MKIDRLALLDVAVVSVVATVVFVALLAVGIRLLSAAQLRTNTGQQPSLGQRSGYLFLAAAAALVLFGLYLIIPFLH